MRLGLLLIDILYLILQDHYKTLGIQSDATEDEIKKGYRRSSLIHHPDKGGSDEKFKEVCSTSSMNSFSQNLTSISLCFRLEKHMLYFQTQ